MRRRCRITVVYYRMVGMVEADSVSNVVAIANVMLLNSVLDLTCKQVWAHVIRN